ncbi:TPA: hypothetical protein ACS719_003727, partial [Providencia alcalifaciens]
EQFQLVIELNKVCIYQYSCLSPDVRNPHLSCDSDRKSLDVGNLYSVKYERGKSFLMENVTD